MSTQTRPIPLLGIGTWGMGGKFEKDTSNIEESIHAIQYGLKLGMRMIDVAEIYGEGLTEEIVGSAIKGVDREKVFIVSKVWKTNLHHADVINACTQSLRRLDTDYIDLYLIHWPNPEIPLSETMPALEQLYDEGKIRAIGVSNFTPELIDEAETYLTHTHVVANQIEYNLMHHEADKDIIPHCTTHDIQVIGYRPFAKGIITERHTTLMDTLAQKYQKTPNQIALNWIMSQGISAIPKTSSKAHLEENMGALGWEMDKEDIEALRHATLLEK